MWSGLIILAFLAYFYFLPFWLCVRYFPDEYRHRVFWWNFWIGWTVVGWFALLLWELVTYPRLVRAYVDAKASRERRIDEARARMKAAFAAPTSIDSLFEIHNALMHQIAVTRPEGSTPDDPAGATQSTDTLPAPTEPVATFADPVAIDELAQLIVATYRKALLRQRSQLVRVDPYGLADTTAWDEEVPRFIDRVALPHMRQTLGDLHSFDTRLFLTGLRERIDALDDESQPWALSGSASPREFEDHCMATLHLVGWDAKVTNRSGDLGIEVHAERAGRALLLHCKRQRGPVGQAAIQQIVAGTQHDDTTIAAVLTASSFTPNARDLARAVGVHLLQLSDLGDFALRPPDAGPCNTSPSTPRNKARIRRAARV